MYFVYILKNISDKKYIGVTKNLGKRILQHNKGETKTTKNKGEYKLIWYSAFAEKQKAYDFEKYLKSSSGFAFRNKRLI